MWLPAPPETRMREFVIHSGLRTLCWLPQTSCGVASVTSAFAALGRHRLDLAQHAAVLGHDDDRARAVHRGDRPVVGLRGGVPAAAVGELDLAAAVGLGGPD